MASKDTRRTASDARRVAGDGASKDSVAKLRTALNDNYERGRAAGRAELATELQSADPRSLMLEMIAEICDAAASRTSHIPNSDKALSAYRESAAILRDAAEGEDPIAPSADKGP